MDNMKRIKDDKNQNVWFLSFIISSSNQELKLNWTVL